MQVHTIDLCFLGLEQAIAAYLIQGPTGPVLIETGPGSTQEALVAGLAEKGLAPGDLSAALVSHIHLDHAGAAGWLAAQGVTIHVHPLGAPHLIAPERLLASAGRIYGDDMDRLWGTMLAAPPERIHAVEDQEVVEAAGLRFRAVETPGHAGHHHTWYIEDEGIAFTGDVAGVRMPGEDLLAVPAPPPEFDLDAWNASLDRLESLGLKRIYPTHFGGFDDVDTHLSLLREEIEACARFVKVAMNAGETRERMIPAYLEWQRQRAADRGISEAVMEGYEAANPLEMSVDGLMRYWRKRGIGAAGDSRVLQ